MKQLGYLFFALLMTGVLSAQEAKKEVEKRIKPGAMPESAVDYIENLPVKPKRLKYYLETDGDDLSFEAKFKNSGRIHSVEFDEKGNLLDIEIIVGKRFPEEATLAKIRSYLNNNFTRHKIEKIQAQYLPLHQSRAFEQPGKPDAFELVVATKNEKNKLQHFEMTFNAEGSFLKSRKIIRRSYDFLLF